MIPIIDPAELSDSVRGQLFAEYREARMFVNMLPAGDEVGVHYLGRMLMLEKIFGVNFFMKEK